MKRSLLALAALTAFAGAASAQSSVTVFGVVDVSARNVKNGDNDVNGLNTDGNASSRLGFRGVEDLGGGLRAGFWLEAGLAADQGTVGGGNGNYNGNAAASTALAGSPGAFFNRRSTVSLLGGFGEIRAGRDYTPWFWNLTVFDPFGTNGVGAWTNIWAQAGSGAQTLVRANNTIGYFLPSLGGVYGQVQVAAAENPSGNTNIGNKSQGLRIGYAGGPINVALGYGQTDKVGTMIDDVKDTNVGFSWNLGFMNLMAQYATSEQGRFKNTGYLGGLTVPIGAGTIKLAYAQSEFDNGTTAPKATQVAVGYVYDLSKRTALYAHYSQVDNDAGLRFTAGAGGPSVAAINGFKSTGYEFGVRHSF